MRTIENNPIWFFDSALSPDDCDKIIQEGKKISTIDAKINSQKGRELVPEHRNGKISFFSKDSFVHSIFTDYILRANIEASWNFNIRGKGGIQFTTYSKGDFYKWHKDCSYKETEPHRKLSVTVQLTRPEEYEGGQLEFKLFNYYKEEILKTSPKINNRGTVIVFPSMVWHQVTPVTKGTRYSLVQWYEGPQFT